jgi:hypothetical protein
MIRSIIKARLPQAPSHAVSNNLLDAELLRCLERLQEDLRWLEADLKARMTKDPKRKRYRQWRDHAAQNQTDLPGHEFGEVESSH